MNLVKEYKLKTKKISAIQFLNNNQNTDEEMNHIVKWINQGKGMTDTHAWHNSTDIFIHFAAGGYMTVYIGDWIVYDMDSNEFFAMNPEQFQEEYEEKP